LQHEILTEKKKKKKKKNLWKKNKIKIRRKRRKRMRRRSRRRRQRRRETKRRRREEKEQREKDFKEEKEAAKTITSHTKPAKKNSKQTNKNLTSRPTLLPSMWVTRQIWVEPLNLNGSGVCVWVCILVFQDQDCSKGEKETKWSTERFGT